MVKKVEWSEGVLSQITGAPSYVGNSRLEPITQAGILEGMKNVSSLFSGEYYLLIEEAGFVVQDGQARTPKKS